MLPWLSATRPWLWLREAGGGCLWPHCSQGTLKEKELPGTVGQGGEGTTAGSKVGVPRLCWVLLGSSDGLNWSTGEVLHVPAVPACCWLVVFSLDCHGLRRAVCCLRGDQHVAQRLD